MIRDWQVPRFIQRRLWAGARHLRHADVPVILMYHRIANADIDPWRLAVSPAVFDKQLRQLKQRRSVLPLLEFAHRSRAGCLPSNAVAITFDDGYACNATVAAPLLEKYQLPATVFVVTGYLSSNEEFWWDALERIIFHTNAECLSSSTNGEAPVIVRLRGELGCTSERNTNIGPSEIRRAAYVELWSRFRAIEDGLRREVLAALHRQSGVPSMRRPTHRVMTVQEARKLLVSGLIDIGAHSVSHPPLSQTATADQRNEIVRSRDACADLSGRLPRAFAYPYGDYGDETIRLVAEAGFDVACTTAPYGVSIRSHMLRMPRIAVHNWNVSQFATAMRSADMEPT